MFQFLLFWKIASYEWSAPLISGSVKIFFTTTTSYSSLFVSDCGSQSTRLRGGVGSWAARSPVCPQILAYNIPCFFLSRRPSVCLSAYLCPIFKKNSACYLWPCPSPSLVALHYVMYFHFINVGDAKKVYTRGLRVYPTRPVPAGTGRVG